MIKWNYKELIMKFKNLNIINKLYVLIILACFQNSFSLEPTYQVNSSLYPQSKFSNININWIFHPYNIWSYQHISEILKTTIISKRNTNPIILKYSKTQLPLEKIYFTEYNGKKTNVSKWLNESNTDGFIVLKNGEIIYEKYFNNMKQYTKHQMFSVTKSFIGTLATVYSLENKIDNDKYVTFYIPELKKTAYRDVKVKDIMNMNVGINYKENYVDISSDFYKYTYSVTNYNDDKKFSASTRDYLLTLKPQKQPLNIFRYASVNTEVIAWILEKITGKKIQELISGKILSKIGADSDAYLIVDKDGVAYAGAGLNITLRDAAKFGQTMLQEGFFNNQRIIPKAAIDLIVKGGDKEAFARSTASHAFPGFSYKNQWWVTHDMHSSYMAIGIFGQWIYIDPLKNMVIVKQSSLKEADTAENSVNTYRTFQSISNYNDQYRK